ncbi:MAG: hypothetical protein ABIP12_06080 [Terriglobales bacterium]
MARGFDSKSVEEQQAAFAAKSAAKSPEDRPRRAPFTSEEAAKNREREVLVLSRKQVAAQLGETTSPRRREMLEQALAELDKKLGD